MGRFINAVASRIKSQLTDSFLFRLLNYFHFSDMETVRELTLTFTIEEIQRGTQGLPQDGFFSILETNSDTVLIYDFEVDSSFSLDESRFETTDAFLLKEVDTISEGEENEEYGVWTPATSFESLEYFNELIAVGDITRLSCIILVETKQSMEPA